jgi:hypothetical protein
MTTPILTEPEVRAFVGLNSDYYLSRWKPLLEGQDWSGFNWAACVLSGLWLPYRKMYGAATVFYGIAFLEVVLEEVSFPPSTHSGLGSFIRLVVAVVCGAFGNEWYFRHAARLVAQTRATGVADDTELAQVLSKLGGTSALAAILFFAGFVAVTILACCVLGVFSKG